MQTIPPATRGHALRAYFQTRSLLTVDNYKMRKDSLSWLKVGLTLSPANESGPNFCPFASEGCRVHCLKTAGRQVYDRARDARIRRSHLFTLDRDTFAAYWVRDLDRARRKAHRTGRKLAARFNVLSDIAWERVAPSLFQAVDQAYDYTKDPRRMEAFLRGHMPSNYHLTFSRSETNERECLRVLMNGGTVAIVVRDDAVKAGMFAHGWHGFPCVDGDESDNRWLDPARHVILLRAKGRAKHDQTGFVAD